MSLKVWLPLIRDVNNQGCSNNIPTNNGGTFTTGGKLGNCLYLSGSTSSYVDTTYSTGNIGTKDFSIALWIKIPTISSGSYFAVCTSKTTTAASCGVGIYWNYSQKKFLWSTADGSIAKEIWMTTAVDTIVYDKWIHLVMIRNSSDPNIGYFYIDGVRYEIASVPTILNIAQDTKLYLGKCTNNNYPIKAFYNDFRIYDHALSLKEVQLLARGLVAHYPLNDPYSTNNLIRNGFGELEMENWTGTLASNSQNTDLPTADTNIKRAYYNNRTSDYIPINRMNTYTLSMYIKQKATSGTTYPSIFPYDADKKFISQQTTPDGFRSGTYTTLSSALNTGDTVIHATDLSNWITASGNYYNSVAVFGYVDGLGYKYPDGTYTQDVPRFASGTGEKTNIDKTTNTITLTSAYTGKPRPAGTTICQTSDGSTYYYPWGGINVASITDWTFKTINLTPNGINRLRWARYIEWFNYSSSPLYYAGLKLIDITNSEVVYDVSGNKYYGEYWRYDSKGDISFSESTPRYRVSTYIDSSDNTTNTASGTVYLYCHVEMTNPQYLSVCFWCKPIAGYGGTTGQGQICTTNNDIGSNAASDYQTSILNHRDSGFDFAASDGTHARVSLSFIANEWHFYSITYDGRIMRTYRDGVLQANTAIGTTDKPLANMKGIVLGFSKAGGAWRSNKSFFSDLRLYATPLSEEDILDLYQNSAHLDNKGNLTAYEFIEG